MDDWQIMWPMLAGGLLIMAIVFWYYLYKWSKDMSWEEDT